MILHFLGTLSEIYIILRRIQRDTIIKQPLYYKDTGSVLYIST